MATGAGGGARRRRSPLSLKGRALALLAQREHSAAELRRKLLRHLRAEAARAGAPRAGDDGPCDEDLGAFREAAAEANGDATVATAPAPGAITDADAADDTDAATDAADTSFDADDIADDALARVEAVIEWLRAHRYLSEERFVESRVHARASRYGNLRIRQELAQHGLALSPEAAQALQDSELTRAAEVWQRKFGTPPSDAAGRAKQSRFLAQRGFSAAVIARVLRNAGAQRAGEEDD